MSKPFTACGTAAVARVLRPRSVAIIGASSRPDAISQSILQGLNGCGFAGPIHLVGKSAPIIDGRPVIADIEALPEGVELAVITLPAAGVRDAIASCVRRKVGAALVLAAGFAEVGAGDVQDDISRIAREGGLALCGPNCMGFTNNIDGLTLHMRYERVSVDARRLEPGEAGTAFVGQSGGMVGHMQRSARKRGMPMSYVISSGNEAGLDLADYMAFLVDDAATRAIAIYAEQIKRPGEFLAMCARARSAGKHIILLHPGRSSRARAAAQSHTGALMGDHGAMITIVRDAGVLVVDSLDEMMDVSELLSRYPEPSVKGPAVLTASGALVALVNDFADELGMEFPALDETTAETLKKDLPAFGTPGNPLDTTAGLAPGALTRLTRNLLAAPDIGSLLIAFPIYSIKPIQDFLDGVAGTTKPVVFVPAGDGAPLPTDAEEAAGSGAFVYWHSSERALRAMALYAAYGKSLARQRCADRPAPFAGLPSWQPGTQVEWIGKQTLAAIGIPTPPGALATNVQEAQQIAARIGYPVVLKAQAAQLSHKTEAGGVILGIGDDAALLAAWKTLHDNVSRANPALNLDGALVERMAPRGLELMLGARRDPAWGPVLLLGLGGIWAEALGDVRLLPATASRDDIKADLLKLRAAALLTGFRGAPPVDIDAVADAGVRLGRLMQTAPAIAEVDINPLVANAQGQGVIALDALIIVNE